MKKIVLFSGFLGLSFLAGSTVIAQTGKASESDRAAARESAPRENQAVQPAQKVSHPISLPAHQSDAMNSKTSTQSQAPASVNKTAAVVPSTVNGQPATRPVSKGNKPAPSGKVVSREVVKEAK